MGDLKKFLKDKDLLKHYFVYIVFGVLTTAVDWLSFWLLRRFVPSLNENISNALAVVISIIFAYFTNRKYVFKSNEINKFMEFWKFFASRLFSLGVNVVSFWFLTDIVSINGYIAKAIIAVFVVILNYITSKIFVFKKSKQ